MIQTAQILSIIIMKACEIEYSEIIEGFHIESLEEFDGFE